MAMVCRSRWRSLPSRIGGFVATIGILAGCSVSQPSAPATVINSASSLSASSVSSAATVIASSAASSASLAAPTVAPTPIATVTPEVQVPTATSTTLPLPTATVAAIATTASGSPVPAAAAAPSTCATLPVRGFGLVWQAHPEVQALVGCPTGAEAAIGVVSQAFEHGWMLQLSASASQTGGRTVIMLFSDNSTVAQVSDTWVAGTDPVTTGLTPPSGLVEPQRDFGKVWRDQSSLRVRARLGWALGPERGASGAEQQYQHGQMIWTPAPKQDFAIGDQAQGVGASGTWRLYPDLFVG